MSKMSRTKGASAEREVAHLVEEWWRQLEPECKFVKTPASGGWSTPQIRASFRASGDLMTDANHWMFSVEVKRRERWHMGNFVTGKRSPVWGWWRQCQKAALEMNAEPMMWVRRSREPWIVVLPDVWGERMPEPDIRWHPAPPGCGASHPTAYLADRLLATDGRFLRWLVKVLRP